MNKIFIDAILPLYKPDESALNEMLESLSLQVFKNFRLIIIDDTPENDYVKKCLGKRDDILIDYYHNAQKIGLSESLNLALNYVESDLIARCDGDDVYHPQRFNIQYKFFDKNKDLDICGTNIIKINKTGDSIGTRVYPEKDKKIKSNLHIYNTIAHPTVMFRRRVIEVLEGYSTKTDIEDYDLWFRAKNKEMIFHNIQENLCSMRVVDKFEHSRPRHHRENLKLKLRYFDKGYFLHSMIGLFIFSLTAILPHNLSNYLFRITNYIR